jgi:hypothetical protein
MRHLFLRTNKMKRKKLIISISILIKYLRNKNKMPPKKTRAGKEERADKKLQVT